MICARLYVNCKVYDEENNNEKMDTAFCGPSFRPERLPGSFKASITC